MNLTIPKAPFEAITFFKGYGERKSPAVLLNDNQAGQDWLEKVKKDYGDKIACGKYRPYMTSSDNYREACYVGKIIQALETRQMVRLWDIRDQIEWGSYVFKEICDALFPGPPRVVGNDPSLFDIWKRVFFTVLDQSKGKVKLTGRALVISEKGYGDHNGATVYGVFQQDGKKVSINFEFIGTWDSIENVNFSVSEAA